MGKIVFLLAFTFIIGNSAFSQWSDNFDDGNFTENPIWIGDTSKFTVNSSGMLQLKALSTDVFAQLATQSYVNSKATWSFNVQMDFNPSSGNYAKIYLMADTADFKNSVTGYFVRIGHTADDICLFKQTGTTTSLLIDGRDKMLNSSIVNTNIQVYRDSAGNWQMFCDTTGNDNFLLLGTAFDNTIKKSKYFGLCCIFTSTRADKFRFNSFVVSGAIYEEPKPVIYAQPAIYDIVINELMADPTPVIALPDAEYVELYNRSNNDYYTKGWALNIGNSKYMFPDTLFKKDTYLIITANSKTSLFAKWGNALGQFTSATVLANSGQNIELRDNKGNIIAWVHYSDNWYSDNFKKDGGWSLEMIDPDNPCTGQNNWKASTSKSGGTPGAKNSVYNLNPDNTAPFLKQIQLVNDSCFNLVFNEPLTISAATSGNFLLGINTIPTNCSFAESGFSIITIQLPEKIHETAITKLKISSNIADCAGNTLATTIDTFVALPKAAEPLDIVINEVLFNSKPYCPEYIEIYNRSDKIVNLFDLLLCIKSGNSENTYRIDNKDILFYPEAYLLLSSNPEMLRNYYALKNEKSLYEITGMGSLDDNTGTITLKTLDDKIIDQFNYHYKMHLTALHNTEGVSLERLNPELLTNIRNNWHSSAETAGYGTPGYQNSQYIQENFADGNFSIENEIFSPNNDGYNDVLPINYKLDEAGVRISAWVFDVNGRKIKELANNSLIGTNGSLYWDGYTDKGTLCPVGMYLIYIKTYNGAGDTKEYKLPCVLALKR